MARQDNVVVFQKTKQMYETEPMLMEAVKNSIAKQKLYITPPETEIETEVEREAKTGETNTNIVVSSKRTLEAASHYTGKTAVLNFASAKYPGGGVEGGANAQEEALCRISTLYPCLCDSRMWNDFYQFHRKQHNPLYSDRLIYTPDVVVFRKDDTFMNVLPKGLWWKVDVITCAAPNKSMMQENANLAPEFISRFKAILAAAKANKADNIVLGAFGCGVFANDPYVVANSAKEALKEFSFKNVEFAVYCSKWDRANFEAFASVFAKNR